MTLHAILAEYGWDTAGALAVLLTFVQFSPLKIDPWTVIARWIGRAINGEVLQKVNKLGENVDSLTKDVEHIRQDADQRDAVTCRIRILRFNDELIHKQPLHSKEHFDQILTDIKQYEDYCELHPGFKNHIADDSIERIRRIYKECGDKGSFI